jgi:hypothetical protein
MGKYSEQELQKLIDKGAKYIGMYSGYLVDLPGENVVEAIKFFYSHWNATLAGIGDVKADKMYKAVENDEPDCRGYFNHSFYDSSGNLIFNVDELTKPIVKVKPSKVSGDIEHCWIDRNGRMYECGFEAHYYLAKELFLSETVEKPEGYYEGNAEDILEDRGWVKISSKRIHWKYGANIKLTQSQKRTIKKWMELKGDKSYEFQHFMTDINEIIIKLDEDSYR